VRTGPTDTQIFHGSYKIEDSGVLKIVPEGNRKLKLILLSPAY
jgi:hypothetical protein